jgi:hypothetical protein
MNNKPSTLMEEALKRKKISIDEKKHNAYLQQRTSRDYNNDSMKNDKYSEDRMKIYEYEVAEAYSQGLDTTNVMAQTAENRS